MVAALHVNCTNYVNNTRTQPIKCARTFQFLIDNSANDVFSSTLQPGACSILRTQVGPEKQEPVTNGHLYMVYT